jgi:hypothetical protein
VVVPNLFGGFFRNDEKLLTWGPTFEVDVLDFDARLLVDRSLEYDALDGSGGVSNDVEFTSGIAVLATESEFVDLSTGIRSTLNVPAADGEILPAVSELLPLSGGVWRVSESMQVTLWEAGEVMARLDLAAGKEIAFD